MDSFRPGATSYCPFDNKAELAETGVAPAGITEDLALLRPSELGLARPAETAERTEDSHRETELPGPGPGPGPLSAEEENRRRLYLNVGRPRPFYGVSQSPPHPAQDQLNATTTALQHKTKVRHLTAFSLLPTRTLIERKAIKYCLSLERRYADFTGNCEEPFSIGDWTGETF